MDFFALLFPHQEFSIESPLSYEDAKNAVGEMVQPTRSFRQFLSGEVLKPYEGLATESSFKIKRTILYKNSFLPMIDGKINWTGNDVKIEISMMLHPTAKAMSLFWVLGIGLGIFFTGSSYFNIPGESPVSLVVMVGLIVFYVAASNLAFWWEAKMSEEFLISAFKGRMLEVR